MNNDFDLQRALLLDEPETRPFNVTRYRLLSDALLENAIHRQEHVLVASVENTVIVFPMLAMVYHHVAQGSIDDMAWMAAYCCLCNGGTVFDPCYENNRYTFAAQGYYDVMILLADEQTQSYWNHLTGTCLYGEMTSATLKRLSPLTQMQAGDVPHIHPHAQLALSEMDDEEITIARRWDGKYRAPQIPGIDEELLATGTASDTRLPRYDMGLGLWTGNTARYYPISKLYEHQSVIVDRVEDRTVIVILDEKVGLPMAFYYQTERAEVHGDTVVFGSNTFYQKGVLLVDGQRIKPERPPQAAIRWYGFSSIFPNCDIYGR
jgi:hypothetical protein